MEQGLRQPQAHARDALASGTRVESGGYRGHAGVRAYMSEARDLWDVLEPVGELFTDAGDHVLVAGRCRVRGRSSGAESNPVCAWVVGLRDGLIVSHRACASYDEALGAAGLDPAGLDPAGPDPVEDPAT